MNSSIVIGNKLADFSALSTAQSGWFKLSEYSEKYCVLYFYPKDSTPGCTTEAEDFRDLYPQFQAVSAEIIGISRDALTSHQRFKQKLGLPFELISDQDEKLCTLFDTIKMKSMYGKQVRGIERSTFVISPQGVLLEAWRGVKVAGHAQQVLEFIAAQV